MQLNTSIQYLKGVGPARADILERVGIRTLEDMLYYFPRAHEDRSRFVALKDLRPGLYATIAVEIVKSTVRRTKTRMSILELVVTDHKKIFQIIFFRQEYLQKVFISGAQAIFSGTVELFRNLQMTNPTYEVLSGNDEDLLHTGRIVPVYSLTQNLNQRRLRTLIKNVLDLCLDQVEETIPADVRERLKMLPKRDALANLHFPRNMELIEQARQRLVFEEFLLMQIGILMARREQSEGVSGIQHAWPEDLCAKFLSQLSFRLTGAQQRVLSEISSDMRSLKSMNRLVQGDVGSGKTIIAICACLMAVSGGFQSAIMVPSEVLAEQHYINIQNLLVTYNIKIQLLVGSLPKKERDQILASIADGSTDLVVGTHALIQDDVRFHNLGLVVIDEQHKFGVSQRMMFRKKGNVPPDLLVLTATPIPRTLAMTVYGDLNVSTIDELPPGRKAILTYWVGENKREGMNGFVRAQIRAGRQVFIIYPLVEESEKVDLKAVTQMYDHLDKTVFPDCTVGLIHGRLTREKKESVMRAFKAKQYDILASTTIVEVGIDVPNATVMIVEDAHRFGLAQLHQLRGRVGRGETQSYCLLVSDATSPIAKERLEAMVKSQDGFELAEQDLKLRGPGEILGTRQHGLPDLRIGDIMADIRIMERARKEAEGILTRDPKLMGKDHQPLATELRKKFDLTMEYLRA